MKIFSAIVSMIIFFSIITPVFSQNRDLPESGNKVNIIHTGKITSIREIKPEDEFSPDSEYLGSTETGNKEKTITTQEPSAGEEITPEDEFSSDSEDLGSTESANKENTIKTEDPPADEEITPEDELPPDSEDLGSTESANKENTIKTEEKSHQENAILNALEGWELNGAFNIPVYADALGVQLYGGLMTEFGNYIKTDTYTQDIMLGLSFIYSSGWKGETELSGYGIFLSSGYQIFLSRYIGNLPWYYNIRFIPHLKIGVFSENIERGGSDWNGTALYFSPALSADIELPSSDKLRVGLHAGYDMFISDEPVRNINLGIFSSFKF